MIIIIITRDHDSRDNLKGNINNNKKKTNTEQRLLVSLKKKSSDEGTEKRKRE